MALGALLLSDGRKCDVLDADSKPAQTMSSKKISKNKKGIAYERYVASILVRQGYRVLFTKKSGDFGADILAQRYGVRLCVQCKAYKAGISAVQEVLGAMAYYNGQGVVAATGFTKSAKALAMRSHVLLWQIP